MYKKRLLISQQSLLPDPTLSLFEINLKRPTAKAIWDLFFGIWDLFLQSGFCFSQYHAERKITNDAGHQRRQQDH